MSLSDTANSASYCSPCQAMPSLCVCRDYAGPPRTSHSNLSPENNDERPFTEHLQHANHWSFTMSSSILTTTLQAEVRKPGSESGSTSHSQTCLYYSHCLSSRRPVPGPWHCPPSQRCMQQGSFQPYGVSLEITASPSLHLLGAGRGPPCGMPLAEGYVSGWCLHS